MNTRQQMAAINTYISQSNMLYGEWAKQHGVSYNMLMILCTLDAGPCTQKQVSESWMIPKQTVNARMPRLWEGTGMWLAGPAAELLGLAVSVPFLAWVRKKYQY